MPLLEVLFLSLVAFLGGAVSGVSGMGGGVLLFSAMTFTTPVATIVPVHGVVQFFSNLSRIFILRKNIVTKMAVAFATGLPFGVLLAIYLIKSFRNPEFLLFLIAVMILLNVAKPEKIKLPLLNSRGFVIVGFFSGILGILVGTVGPFVSLFFLREDLKKEQIVATKAVVQFFVHMTKIPTYIYLGFAFSNYIVPIMAMTIAAILGNKVGIGILYLMSEAKFRLVFKTIISISAAKLIYDGILSLLS